MLAPSNPSHTQSLGQCLRQKCSSTRHFCSQSLLVTAKEMSAVFHPNFYEATGARFLSAQAVQPTSIILAFTCFIFFQVCN